MNAVPGLRTADGSRAADGMGTARAWCVLAPNPSPMTLDGTNTWVLTQPGSPSAIVVDPGPDDARHRESVMAAVATGGANEIGLVLLTHGHRDHSAGARSVARG